MTYIIIITLIIKIRYTFKVMRLYVHCMSNNKYFKRPKYFTLTHWLIKIITSCVTNEIA